MADNHPMQRFYGILSGYSHRSHVCITAEYTLCGIVLTNMKIPLLLALTLFYPTAFLHYV
ncbi:uncharacterized protein ASPGLDRAFT_41083 [Aspergillus glaucus CBS 516.65]|uniref:Uncharacterized protein n=1 Tax=Aspergillus glaucus CBS 516.65 TaxID=1160497 RepID=A0A1L9VYY2_ASPGL|nr:hypothetical protein ASPGLDRAFT_41083 [Aspergillus glaucus CBS 516.65]OJJ89140.1 hypothetical protein ASPGLDRAFT_41083 [Aspergillus glaucus CBS 516.65]